MNYVGVNDKRGWRNPRYKWLAQLINENGYRIGAEVGVDLGTTTQYILMYCPCLELLYAVDLWNRPTQIGRNRKTREWINHPDKDIAIRTFNERVYPFQDRVKVLRGISWEMAELVPDKSLDFVFIDADHKYRSVKNDIRAWAPKVRKGGLITGHDINMNGVYRAVRELTKEFTDVGVDKCWYCRKEDIRR